jgi:translocation and assembly module TamA
VATRGYFSPKVTPFIDRSTQPWTVVLHVEPGQPARVSGAELQFSGPAATEPEATPLLARIRREWRLPPGARFSQDSWNDAKASATRALAAWRYAAARVASSRALVDRDAGQAALSAEIESGPPFRYGALRVSGTERYSARMVEELSPAEPGEFYDRETLRLYERRLLATGYFASAQVGIVAEPDQADAAPVRVTLIESKAQQAETGLSFNTDVGVRAEARYRNMDLFNTAWRLRSEVQLDRKIRQGRIDLDAPPQTGGTWRSHFIQARETEIQNEINTELSGGVSYNWGLGGEPSSLTVSGHVEEQRISGALADHRHAIFFGYRTQFRDTDAWESPRRGYILEMSAGGAPRALASQQFVRGTARAMLFVPLGRDDVLLRAEVGTVFAPSRAGVPASFLFRTGGDQTVRGYAFESLGVRQAEAVLGARRLLAASAEYIHWIGDSWGIAGFVDGGNAWDSGGFAPVYGIGTGVRFRTPIGPVRGDVAYGTQSRKLRLHLSVGFAF